MKALVILRSGLRFAVRVNPSARRFRFCRWPGQPWGDGVMVWRDGDEGGVVVFRER